MPDPDVKVLVERLDRLERSHRRLKRLSGVGLVVAAVAVLSGQAAGRRVVSAERFVLRDGSGTVRGAFEIVPDANVPQLWLSSENSGAALIATPGNALLRLRGDQGGVSAELVALGGLGSMGSAAELKMQGRSPEDRVSMTFLPTGKGNRAALWLSAGTESRGTAISADDTGGLLVSDPTALPPGGPQMRRVALQRP